MMNKNNKYFPCPVCQNMIPVCYAKNRKPYCTCNDCMVQLFIIGKNGIKKFEKLVSKRGEKIDSKELLNSVNNFNKLKEKLEEIKLEKPLLGEDKDLNIQEKIIKKELNNLRKKFKDLYP